MYTKESRHLSKTEAIDTIQATLQPPSRAERENTSISRITGVRGFDVDDSKRLGAPGGLYRHPHASPNGDRQAPISLRRCPRRMCNLTMSIEIVENLCNYSC